MEGRDIREMLIEVQDFLAPKLDSYEQMLYHYLLRHTHVEGRSSTTVGTRTLQTRAGLGVGQAGSSPSQKVVVKKLRSLEEKGCVEILSKSRKGTEIRVRLPREIPGISADLGQTPEMTLEELDFFNTTELRPCILEREGHRCFYCLRRLTDDAHTIDHVVPQAEGGDHSYTNVVACCFECNSRKQNTNGARFVLENYREGLLTAEERLQRATAIENLRSGQLKPDVAHVV